MYNVYSVGCQNSTILSIETVLHQKKPSGFGSGNARQFARDISSALKQLDSTNLVFTADPSSKVSFAYAKQQIEVTKQALITIQNRVNKHWFYKLMTWIPLTRASALQKLINEAGRQLNHKSDEITGMAESEEHKICLSQQTLPGSFAPSEDLINEIEGNILGTNYTLERARFNGFLYSNDLQNLHVLRWDGKNIRAKFERSIGNHFPFLVEYNKKNNLLRLVNPIDQKNFIESLEKEHSGAARLIEKFQVGFKPVEIVQKLQEWTKT